MKPGGQADGLTIPGSGGGSVGSAEGCHEVGVVEGATMEGVRDGEAEIIHGLDLVCSALGGHDAGTGVKVFAQPGIEEPDVAAGDAHLEVEGGAEDEGCRGSRVLHYEDSTVALLRSHEILQ